MLYTHFLNKRTTLLICCIGIMSIRVFAQPKKLEEAKSYLGENKYAEAKKNIDEATIHPKTSNLVETWYVRGLVYNGISFDPNLSTTYPNALDTSFEAFKKAYVINKEEYQKFATLYNTGTNPATYVYGGFYKKGADFFNQKKFQEALPQFLKAEDVNKFLATDIISNRPTVDTSLLVNIAIVSENAGDKKMAAEYYSKVADLKAVGETYAQIYKWLCYYYYKTELDSVKLEKYIFLGKKLYPTDDFYSKLQIDIKRNKPNGVAVNYEDLFNSYETALSENPNNIDVLNAYKADLFSYLFPTSGKKIANGESYYKKLDDLFITLLNLEPNRNSELSLEYGKFFYNDYTFSSNDIQPLNIKKNSLEEQLYNLKKSIKNKKASKTDTEKILALTADLDKVNKEKDLMKAKGIKKLDSAIKYLEIPYNVGYAKFKQGGLKGYEKTNLKVNIDLLISCYSEKKDKIKSAFYEDKYSEIK